MRQRAKLILAAFGMTLIAAVSAIVIPQIANATGPVGNGPMLTQSGVYTPTLDATSSVNVSSATFSDSHWMRVGDVVSVSGRVMLTPTTAANTLTFAYFTLPSEAPYAPATPVSTDAVGQVMGETAVSSSQTDGRIAMGTAHSKPVIFFYSSSNVSKSYWYNFQYVVR